MTAMFRRFVREDEGQDLVEYVMLLALIAIVAVAGATTLGTNVNLKYNSVATSAPINP